MQKYEWMVSDGRFLRDDGCLVTPGHGVHFYKRTEVEYEIARLRERVAELTQGIDPTLVAQRQRIYELEERVKELERGIEAATLINNEHQERESRLLERVADLESESVRVRQKWMNLIEALQILLKSGAFMLVGGVYYERHGTLYEVKIPKHLSPLIAEATKHE
jgi:chromosome segregation ATPase